MRIAALLAAMGLAATAASGQILITEIQSNASLSGPFEDWFELTNFGNSAVDLTGWVYDDDTANPALGFTFGALSIAPGESIVFVEDLTDAEFHSWWGTTPGSYQVVTFSGSGLSLGRGDAVNIFDDNGVLQTSLSYAAPGGFTTSAGTPSGFNPGNPTQQPHSGQAAGAIEQYITLVYDPAFGPTDPRYTFAQIGILGAFQAGGSNASGERALDIGSPGVIPAPGTLALLGLGGLAGARRRRA